MEKRIHAVVLNYNQEQNARQARDELLRSRGIDVDVLVVDAASASDDRESLRQHVPADRLLLLEQNLGYAGGMNAGIAFWRAIDPETAILLVTPDCRVSDDVMVSLWNALTSDARIGATGPVVVYRESPSRRIGAGGKIVPDRARLITHTEIQATTPYDVDWIEGCCMLLRPQALQEVRGLDEEYFLYFEETDLCQRLRQANWRVVVAPSVSVRHLKPVGHAPTHYYYYMTRNGYRFWAKNFGVPIRVFAAEIIRLTLWMAALAVASMLLPSRWSERRGRWRDLLLQLRGVWKGTRDYLIGRHGPEPTR
jgi:GT2 family glycosyltransferase